MLTSSALMADSGWRHIWPR